MKAPPLGFQGCQERGGSKPTMALDERNVAAVPSMACAPSACICRRALSSCELSLRERAESGHVDMASLTCLADTPRRPPTAAPVRSDSTRVGLRRLIAFISDPACSLALTAFFAA